MRRYTLIVFIFTLLFAAFTIYTQEIQPSFYGEKEGYITKIKNSNNSFMVYIDEVAYRGFGHSQGYRLGDYINIKGEFIPILNIQNKDYGRYLKSKGVDFIVEKGSLKALHSPTFNFHTLPSITTTFIENTLNSLYGSKSDLPKALLTGFTLEKEELLPFRQTGTSHILALSGFHVGFIFLFLSIVLFFVPLNIKWTLISIFLLFYCYITGMKPSIIRASSFFWIYFLCFKFALRFDTLSVLFSIASIMIALNPYSIFDPGFCLSFLSVASITMFTPMFISLRRKLFPNQKNKLFLYTYNLIIVTISAQILSLPYSLSLFGNLPLLSIIGNLITLPLVSLLMALVLLSLSFSFIMPFARLLSALGCIIIDIILNTNNYIASLTYSSIELKLSMPSAIITTILLSLIYIYYQYYQIRETLNEI